MSLEAMKLGLAALDIVKIHFTQNRHVNEAITALRHAIENAKQQAEVAYMVEVEDAPHGVMLWPARQYNEACTYCDDIERPTPLYTAPPQPYRLLDSEIIAIAKKWPVNKTDDWGGYIDFARALERAAGGRGNVNQKVTLQSHTDAEIIDPTKLLNYLMVQGWTVLEAAIKDRLYVLENKNFPGRQLVYPMDITASDYQESVDRVFRKLNDITRQKLQ